MKIEPGQTRIVKKLPSRTLSKATSVVCVGCETEIDSPFYYTGTIIKGTGYGKREVVEQAPVKVWGSIEVTHTGTVHPILVGGETEVKQKSFSYFNKVKGAICDSCAADYSVIEKKDGSWEPRVKTDPSPTYNQIFVPQVERELEGPSRAFEKGSSSPTSRSPRPSAPAHDNHWLDVGRRRR